ncbi:MAG TPA: hypothetical protein VED40_17505 [Azospirillaceae bacterium]|nr:hypothetical protein [Azospirillaceae bacterium]
MTDAFSYAAALEALVRSPGREALAALVETALLEERAADAVRVLPALRDRIGAVLHHQAMAALLLETEDFRLARYHLEALAPAGAPPELVTDLCVTADLRAGDAATAVSRLEALEARGGRGLPHFFRKWMIQHTLGRFDIVEHEIGVLLAQVPADQVRSHALLRFHLAGVAHNRRRFADAAAQLDRLLEDCLERGLAAQPEAPPVRRRRTAGRMRRLLADLESIVILHALPVAITGAGLLGLVRDGGPLPHDKDLDMAVLEPATAAGVAGLLAATGLFRLERGPFTFGGYCTVRHQPTDMLLDLVTHAADGGRRMNRWHDADGALLRETALPFYRPRLVAHAGTGLRLPMPDDADAHLTALYGDWRVPDADFTSLLSARALTGHTPFLASLGRIKALEHLIQGRKGRGAAILRQLLAREPHSPALRRAAAALG